MFADDNGRSEWGFKVGDVVTLKSGSVKMTVTDVIEDGRIECMWSVNTGMDLQYFRPGALIRIEGEGGVVNISFRCPICGRYTRAILPEIRYDAGDMVTTVARVFCSNDECMQEFEFGVAR